MQLHKFFRYSFLLLVLSITFNCKEEQKAKTKDKIVINFKKEGTLNILKAQTDSIVKTLDIEIADTDYETQTGLMYREELGENQGMLFIFPNEQVRSFYMKNTKIPLDIIYIDENKSIVSFQKNAKPYDETSLPSNAPAKYVLEVYSGLSDAWELEVGDKIAFEVIQ